LKLGTKQKVQKSACVEGTIVSGRCERGFLYNIKGDYTLAAGLASQYRDDPVIKPLVVEVPFAQLIAKPFAAGNYLS
jgi:hypothetical protein